MKYERKKFSSFEEREIRKFFSMKDISNFQRNKNRGKKKVRTKRKRTEEKSDKNERNRRRVKKTMEKGSEVEEMSESENTQDERECVDRAIESESEVAVEKKREICVEKDWKNIPFQAHHYEQMLRSLLESSPINCKEAMSFLNTSLTFFHWTGSGCFECKVHSMQRVKHFCFSQPCEGQSAQGVSLSSLSFIPNVKDFVSLVVISKLLFPNRFCFAFPSTILSFLLFSWNVLLTLPTLRQPSSFNFSVNKRVTYENVVEVFKEGECFKVKKGMKLLIVKKKTVENEERKYMIFSCVSFKYLVFPLVFHSSSHHFLCYEFISGVTFEEYFSSNSLDECLSMSLWFQMFWLFFHLKRDISFEFPDFHLKNLLIVSTPQPVHIVYHLDDREISFFTNVFFSLIDLTNCFLSFRNETFGKPNVYTNFSCLRDLIKLENIYTPLEIVDYIGDSSTSTVEALLKRSFKWSSKGKSPTEKAIHFYSEEPERYEVSPLSFPLSPCLLDA